MKNSVGRIVTNFLVNIPFYWQEKNFMVIPNESKRLKELSRLEHQPLCFTKGWSFSIWCRFTNWSFIEKTSTALKLRYAQMSQEHNIREI
jgi:hypothetical protein